MALNYPGPYVIKTRYSVNSTPGGDLEHFMSWNVDVVGTPTVGTAFSAIQLIDRNGGYHYADGATNAMLNLLAAPMNSTYTEFVECTLWKCVASSFEMDFVSSFTPTVTWTNAAGVNEASQINLSFRTEEGNIMFLNMLDTTYAVHVRQGYSAAPTAITDIVDRVIDGDLGICLGRDTSYPINFIGVQTSINDKIFKLRYR